ncbi:ATP-binding protein [Nocardioides sp. AN3]
MELRRWDWVLAGDQASVRAARVLVAQSLPDVSRTSLEIVVLLTSELVTNAVHHGTGPVQLRLSRDDQGVRVEVADESSERPVLRPIDHDAHHGRGLLLVDALASGWGVDSDKTGKTVWFRLAW